MAESFEKRYPNIAAWVQEHEGWIEIGPNEFSSSMIRVIDLGGMIWESEKRYDSIDEALAEADQAIVENWP
jgi:hypothetical protein